MGVSIIPQDFLQSYVDQFIDEFGIGVCANDYNSQPLLGPVQTNAVHDLFEAPFVKPVFVVINCVSNSPSRLPDQLLFRDSGGRTDPEWNALIGNIRYAIDSVTVPPPQLTNVRRSYNGRVQFTFPGQIGKTNFVEGTTNLVAPMNWTVVGTYVGTNGPITFRDESRLSVPMRFYRVRRL